MGKSIYVRLACVSAAALSAGLGLSDQAHSADAFGISGQSAYFNGMSNAGAAAGGDISSMYWNPAATATLPGFNTSLNVTGAFIGVNEHATGGALVGAPYSLNPNTDVGVNSLPLSSFATYQVSDRFYLGFALNAPFGLITKPDNFWAGSPLETTSRIFSIDLNPTAAYRLTPEVTIGVGVQALYVKARLDSAGDVIALPPSPFAAYDIPNKAGTEDGWGVGATAGIMWQPREGTSIGLGYRSRVDVDYSGTFSSSALGGTSNAISGTLPLPDEVTLSARQALTPRLTVLGTVEWQNWSRIGSVVSTSPTVPNPQLGYLGGTVHFNYQDSWSVSGGLEYAYSPSLTLRGGLAYDRSPASDSVRDNIIPDSDDIALSVGASYRFSDKITIDVSYTHEFFDDAPYCIQAPQVTGSTHCSGVTPPLLVGSASPVVDAVAVGLKYRWSGNAPLESLK